MLQPDRDSHLFQASSSRLRPEVQGLEFRDFLLALSESLKLVLHNLSDLGFRV